MLKQNSDDNLNDYYNENDNNGDENSNLIDMESEKELLLYSNKIKESKLSKWMNILIVFAILFFGEVARGIIIPTITLYTDEMGGTASLLGIVISAFSLGRLIATMVLGMFSNHTNYKQLFNGSIFLCVISCLGYCLAYIEEDNVFLGQSILVSSRFLLGFGAGTLSVVRAYLADITMPNERTTYIALSSALQFLGFAVSPIIGSLLTYLPVFYVGPIKIDQVTSPGWFLFFQNLILLLVIILFFSNPSPSQLIYNTSYSSLQTINVENESKNNNNGCDLNFSNEESTSTSSNCLSNSNSLKNSSSGINASNDSMYKVLYKNKRVFINLVLFVIINFLIRAVLGIYETIGTPIYNNLDDTIDSKNSGYFFGGLGFMGIFLLLLISWFCKKDILHDYWILMFGNLVMLAGCFITMVHQMNWTQFTVSYILIWGFGFPLAQTVVVSMFSKAISSTIGNASQGTLMGIIGSSGSLGRVVGPFFSGYLYNQHDLLPVSTFAMGLSLLLLFMSIIVIPKDIIKIRYLNYSDEEE
ncbi:hypothetical protein DICPUDRAFT_153860 [Dictyostelium purpureum]|uniref:Major facilitator superfamily (MFS) profile domain-containing protein n=1 Tax=Dictyostelium purpureum TaxID=5786 RepID=F0ZPX5_DICPU|nr:uncharacterized protein DICPUDRAFT_153860 [Dictyostelium purpureum]EGC33993.1 hypothetical protein DICPUDRAFT_153860 [Dictyostelium purpureum]|eukprot:XP_003289479.1 hypothetical protein DICPUDRAFT_153860 [Dictyostelium purpureum]